MLNEFLRRLRYWLRADRDGADLEQEMRLHLELRAERLRAGGMTAAEASSAARRGFGNPLRLRERSREVWISRSLDDFGRDVRTGVRSLRRDPSFTATVLLILALGIGANTAVFQLTDALRYRPLPVNEPQQLALLGLADRKGWRGSQERAWSTLTNPQWEYLRDHQDVFSGVIAWSPNTFGYGTHPRPVRGLFVSGDFFRVLGVAPTVGRVFTGEEDRRGCGLPGAVLSHGFWQSEFGGDDSAVGRTVTLNHQPVVVLGVADPTFAGIEVGRGFDIAVPICSQATLWSAGDWLDAGAVWWLTVMGRTVPNQDLAEVNERLKALSPALFAATLSPKYPRENAADYLKMTLRATPGATGVSEIRDQYGDPLVVLLAGTALVLLLACANLGNMVLARASAREHELALRSSIGASRPQLFRQLMVENSVLAFLGASLGLFVAAALGRYLVRFLTTEGSTLLLDVRPDLRLTAFCTLVALSCCGIFGLWPAWRASSADAGMTLRTSGRATAGRSGAKCRQILLIAQVTLSVILVFGAVLFSRTLRNVVRVDAGFEWSGILRGWIDYSRAGVPSGARHNFQRQLLDEIRATPGVAAAAETGTIPLSGSGGESAVWPARTTREHAVAARTHFVSDGYFPTMKIRLLAGRDFDRSDSAGRPRVAVINQTLARRLGLGENPVGERFRKEANPWEPETSYEIIGLVNDTKYFNLKEQSPPIAYYSTAQIAEPDPMTQVVVRSQTSQTTLTGMLRQTLLTRYPGIEIELRPFDTMIRDGLLRERLLALVSGFFGVLAALIAAVGVYGVISYLIVRRTREIGIRVALGARRGTIVRALVSETTWLVVIGVALGIIGSIGAGRAARSMLFGLEPYDPATLAMTVTAVVGLAALSSLFPTWRAVRLDPLKALRTE